MVKESEALLDNVIELIYYMRGSVTYNDVMHMSRIERNATADFVNKQLEKVSKMAHPVF